MNQTFLNMSAFKEEQCVCLTRVYQGKLWLSGKVFFSFELKVQGLVPPDAGVSQ